MQHQQGPSPDPSEFSYSRDRVLTARLRQARGNGKLPSYSALDFANQAEENLSRDGTLKLPREIPVSDAVAESIDEEAGVVLEPTPKKVTWAAENVPVADSSGFPWNLVLAVILILLIVGGAIYMTRHASAKYV